MATVNEKTTAYVAVKFYDKAGALAAPSSVTWRLDCMTNSQQIADWSSISPASEIEITVGFALNAIINQANDTERRVVTVRAVYGASDELHSEFVYILQNLRNVS